MKNRSAIEGDVANLILRIVLDREKFELPNLPPVVGGTWGDLSLEGLWGPLSVEGPELNWEVQLAHGAEVNTETKLQKLGALRNAPALLHLADGTRVPRAPSRPPLGFPDDRHEPRARVQHHFVRWLLDGAARRPLLLAVDDAHATDMTSAGVLAELAHMARSTRLLLVTTELLGSESSVAVLQRRSRSAGSLAAPTRISDRSRRRRGRRAGR